MLVLTHAALATVDELFGFKSQGFKLADFPGYTANQWGIKAHNRRWIEMAGHLARGQKILEVGAGYSVLPKYLADKYALEAWVGDDYGVAAAEHMWARWGNSQDLPTRHAPLKYIFEKFGSYPDKYPSQGFDRIIPVSTLEHVQAPERLPVLKDIHRCLKPGGMELHPIGIPIAPPLRMVAMRLLDRLQFIRTALNKYVSDIERWFRLFEASEAKLRAVAPPALQLLDRRILVESPDVVYRFYPPNDAPKSLSALGVAAAGS